MSHLDDIALFFSKNGSPAACYISHAVYADPANQLPPAVVEAYWAKTALLEERRAQAAKPYFVTNLSLLEEPGVAPWPDPQPVPVDPAMTPDAGDLVVFPWDRPGDAYLVRKATYEDATKCPPIDVEESSDLEFMALTEGVVLANTPKDDPTGVTCFLLNLLALRSYP